MAPLGIREIFPPTIRYLILLIQSFLYKSLYAELKPGPMYNLGSTLASSKKRLEVG